MQPGRKPPSTLETLLLWVFAGLFAVNLLLVVPTFASGLGLDLPGRFLPRVDPGMLLSSGSKLTDGVVRALKVRATNINILRPAIASAGSNAIVSVYAPMVATPTAILIDEDEPAPTPVGQKASAVPVGSVFALRRPARKPGSAYRAGCLSPSMLAFRFAGGPKRGNRKRTGAGTSLV
jgi:hypothetical protein